MANFNLQIAIVRDEMAVIFNDPLKDGWFMMMSLPYTKDIFYALIELGLMNVKLELCELNKTKYKE